MGSNLTHALGKDEKSHLKYLAVQIGRRINASYLPFEAYVKSREM